MRKFMIAVIALFGLAVGSSVNAERYYNEDIQLLENTGIVEHIDQNGMSMIIGDIPYAIADYVVVRGKNKKSMSLKKLRLGDKITFATSSEAGQGMALLIEIHVLPESFGSSE